MSEFQPDVKTMLERLQSHAPFDRVEVWFGESGKDARIRELTEEVEQAKAEIMSQSERIKSLTNENSTLKTKNEEQERSIAQLKLENPRQQELVRVSGKVSSAGELSNRSWYGSYNVRAFVIVSPDGKSAYEFYIQDEVDDVLKEATTWEGWRKHIKKERLSCSGNVWCVIGCKSIRGLLNRYDVKFADMVLTDQWEYIKDPEKTEVRSLIILESKSKKEERALELRKERERANPPRFGGPGIPPDKNWY